MSGYDIGRSHNQPPNRPFNLASSSDSDNQLGQALANVRKLRRKLNQIVCHSACRRLLHLPHCMDFQAKNPTQPRSPTPPSERLAHFTIRIPPKALERFRRAQDARLKQRSAKAQTGDNGDSDSQLEDETLLDADRSECTCMVHKGRAALIMHLSRPWRVLISALSEERH